MAGLGQDRAGGGLRRIHHQDGAERVREDLGNLGAQMWTADLADGRTEVMTVSWWSSRADIEGFAGQDIDVAVFYPGMTATSSAGRPLSRTMRWRRRCDTARTS